MGDMAVWFRDILHAESSGRSEKAWWTLGFGTLLGAVCGNDIFDHDIDLDFIILRNDGMWIVSILRKRVDDVDPPYFFRKMKKGQGLKLFLSSKNKAHIDLWYSWEYTNECMAVS